MICAIDPGDVRSAYVVVDEHDGIRPHDVGIVENLSLRLQLPVLLADVDRVVIEMIGHYGTGMPAGKTVFDTCVWIGRWMEVAVRSRGLLPELVLRPTVKAHLCGSARAKDPNVTQALIDRFAAGEPNRGKGTKSRPGWFHGFRADIWAAYAVAVWAADNNEQGGSL